MRHRNHSHRLSQKPHHAKLMLRSMLTSFLLYENIRTTKKRAQVLRPMIDQVLTIGKNNRADVAIRRINAIVTHPNACRKVLEVFIKRYDERSSGFTRVKPVGMRKGDGAKMVDVSFVEGKEVKIEDMPEKSTKKTRTTKSTTNAAKKTSNKSLSSLDSSSSLSS